VKGMSATTTAHAAAPLPPSGPTPVKLSIHFLEMSAPLDGPPPPPPQLSTTNTFVLRR
jgi:hypothetical protein